MSLRFLGRTVALLAVAASTLARTASAQGPVSKYYLTDGDSFQGWIAQGASATFFKQSYNEYAIAVYGDIRTLYNGNDGYYGNGQPTFLGAQYSLTGTPTGTTYGYPVLDEAFYDGTTDGVYNYAASYKSGTVWRFDRNWGNATQLFATTYGDTELNGITYDPSFNGFWVAQWNGTQILQYSMTGTLLSSFNAPFASISSLAMDYATGTLWFGTQGQMGTFWNYATNGTQLGSVTYANMTNSNTLGGEFEYTGRTVTPEPASLALVGVGLAALVVGAKRRRRA